MNLKGKRVPDPIEIALARIEVKLDEAIRAREDHEARLRAVEAHDVAAMKQEQAKFAAALDGLSTWRWQVIGSAAAVAALLSFLVAAAGLAAQVWL
jgi:hypothetical protein